MSCTSIMILSHAIFNIFVYYSIVGEKGFEP